MPYDKKIEKIAETLKSYVGQPSTAALETK